MRGAESLLPVVEAGPIGVVVYHREVAEVAEVAEGSTKVQFGCWAMIQHSPSGRKVQTL